MIRIAVALLWTLVALAALRVILTFAMYDQMVSAYIDDWTNGDPGLAKLMTSTPDYTGVALIFGLGFGPLVALSAVGVAFGKRWGQIVAVVACVLTAVGGLTPLVSLYSYPVLFQVVGALTMALSVVVIVSLFLPDARRCFARR